MGVINFNPFGRIGGSSPTAGLDFAHAPVEDGALVLAHRLLGAAKPLLAHSACRILVRHVVEALMLGPHPYGVHIDANTVVTRLYADGTLGIMVETLNVFSVKLT